MRYHKRRYHRKRHAGRIFKILSENMENRGIYRSRKGMFMGVCRGLSDFLGIRTIWIRLAALIAFLLTGFWPVGVLYIIAGLILRAEPVSPLRNENDKEFYQSYTQSRHSAIQRIKRKYENIERRIQRMEDTVTSREFDWK